MPDVRLQQFLMFKGSIGLFSILRRCIVAFLLKEGFVQQDTSQREPVRINPAMQTLMTIQTEHSVLFRWQNERLIAWLSWLCQIISILNVVAFENDSQRYPVLKKTEKKTIRHLIKRRDLLNSVLGLRTRTAHPLIRRKSLTLLQNAPGSIDPLGQAGVLIVLPNKHCLIWASRFASALTRPYIHAYLF
jgi:hypothetical protein